MPGRGFGDRRDRIEMRDVERTDDRDAGFAQGQRILPTLGMRRAFRVVEREFVEHHHVGFGFEERGELRNAFEALGQVVEVRTFFGFKAADDHPLAGVPHPACIFEQPAGLAGAGREPPVCRTRSSGSVTG